MNSIRRRLGLGLAASLLLVGICLLQSSLWLLESGLRRNLASHLQAEAEGLLVAIAQGPDGAQLDPTRLNPRYQRAFSGHYFHIQLPDRAWRSRSLWDHELPWPATPGLSRTLIDGPQAQALLTYRGEYRRQGQSVVISVAQDYTPILDSFSQVRWAGLGLVGLALLLLLMLQRWTMKHALRPLEDTRRQIAQLHQGQRLQLDSAAPEELQPLVQQINRLLSQTETTLKRSRHALGNLGHALKTPLAVLYSLARRDELAAHPALQAALTEQLQQIEQRLARELGRARLAGEVLPGRFFDCAQELPALFDTLAAIHRPGLRLSWQAPPDCRLPRDREDVLELLGNLLDNACKWAVSEVRLQIGSGDGGWRLTVDDDGPGIDPPQHARVQQRGVRLDEAQPGHGLGLAIVADIVDAWQGECQLSTSPLGGLRVAVEWPDEHPPLDPRAGARAARA